MRKATLDKMEKVLEVGIYAVTVIIFLVIWFLMYTV